eukprot:g40247.t1
MLSRLPQLPTVTHAAAVRYCTLTLSEEHLYLVSEPVSDPNTYGTHVLGQPARAQLRRHQRHCTENCVCSYMLATLIANPTTSVHLSKLLSSPPAIAEGLEGWHTEPLSHSFLSLG